METGTSTRTDTPLFRTSAPSVPDPFACFEVAHVHAYVLSFTFVAASVMEALK
jgi:hypothetical protein